MSRIVRLPANSQAYFRVLYDAEQQKFDARKMAYNYVNAAFPAAWAAWPFRETTGAFLDATGNGHDLALPLNRSYNRVAGVLGNCVEFPADTTYTSDGLTCSSAPDLRNNQSFSIPFWFNASLVGTALQVPLYLDFGADSSEYPEIDIYNNGSALGVGAYLNSLSIDSVNNYSVDANHLGIMIYDGAGLHLYVDNVLDGSDTGLSEISAAASSMKFTSPTHDSESCRLDETAIYLTALTAAQRARLWNNGAGWSPY